MPLIEALPPSLKQTWVSHLHLQFFCSQISTVGPPYPWVLHLWVRRPTVLLFVLIRDLSIFQCWHLQGQGRRWVVVVSWNQFPADTEG